ncbi:UNVERIFIED_CONTAM: Pollen allergen Che a 1 [Sesamum calycinum]|uniref:Pollen allergen Che a 1 n=1 Tax=Sesamum calycinum TaxID=2727403 RepID=A0AAW2Q7H6_9LAMI
MARLAIVLAGALCLLSLAQLANSHQPQFTVKGRVFCEVCRANFINKFSKPMAGAEVKLECKDEESGIVTYSVTGGVTDDKGEYSLMAEGDHEEEYCEVTLVKSSQPDCAEIPVDGLGEIPAAEITLTANNGFHDVSLCQRTFSQEGSPARVRRATRSWKRTRKTRSPCLDAIIYMTEF